MYEKIKNKSILPKIVIINLTFEPSGEEQEGRENKRILKARNVAWKVYSSLLIYDLLILSLYSNVFIFKYY